MGEMNESSKMNEINMDHEIAAAQEKFAELIRSEFERIERMKQDKEVKDFSKLD